MLKEISLSKIWFKLRQCLCSISYKFRFFKYKLYIIVILATKEFICSKVLSGFQLPRAPGQQKDRKVRPYVVVQVRGVASDSRAQRTATAPTAGGFHVLWNAQFRFGVAVPQVAFVRFEVRDSEKDGPQSGNDPVLATYTSRLLCVRSGFCSVPLVSAARLQNEQPPRLFVRVDLQLPEVQTVSRL